MKHFLEAPDLQIQNVWLIMTQRKVIKNVQKVHIRSQGLHKGAKLFNIISFVKFASTKSVIIIRYFHKNLKNK